jgi:regulator of PEP synthase PpsR (kinase-PPPase family)
VWHMGMRPIYLRSPGHCGSPDGDFTRFHRVIPDSQVIPPGLSAREGRWDRPGESGSESGVWRQTCRLSPLCCRQSRVSPWGCCGVSWAVAGRNFHVHLVSDSTGETVSSVARACLVQYEGIFVQEHVWSLVRTRGQMDKVMQAVERDRGPVLYTLVDQELRDLVRDHCRRLQLPCVGVLDQAMSVLAVHFHSKSEQWPGRQHQLDEGYFDRIDAMHFTLAHDDGQSTHDLEDADVILVGPSRTSKTPTCVYLANRGVRAANVPLVPSVEPPAELESAKRPLIVGLITDPERLVQIRVNRLRLLQQDTESEYTDMERVQGEIQDARRLYARRKWVTIDVTRRSIEETAAAILQMLATRREQRLQAG